jgi:translation initiation factor IF-2
MTDPQPTATGAAPAAPPAKKVSIPAQITVRELSEALGITPIDAIKDLMKAGVMAAINQAVDFETASKVAVENGFEVQALEEEAAAEDEEAVEEDPAKLMPRPPVVTVMGHVDHGKTSILDAIRETRVTAQEFGEITQHIGAYQTQVDGHPITFIDTPGHAAFTEMRARGANVTDITILVVAADDGVMPQTIEAIDHAKAAEVPIIVAINKIDLPAANPDNVKQQLTQSEIVVEDFGGDVPAIPVSATTKQGLDDLLEHIQLLAEISELKANPDRPAEGVVIESRKDPHRGPVATLIVQRGTLRVGDLVLATSAFGKVKAMFDDRGKKLKEAPPSTPVEIMGLDAPPGAGETFAVVTDERDARAAVDDERRRRSDDTQTRRVTLETISGEIAAGSVKELEIILKADTQGSVEAIQSSLEQLSTEEVIVQILHASVGTVSESDVMLALASRAIIISFNVKIEPGAKRQADSDGIDIRPYKLIYELLEDTEKAVKGLHAPVIKEVVDGHAEVRATFKVKGGRIAGCMVTDGLVNRSSSARVLRGGRVLHESRVSSLRRFKDDVREVNAGLECGIGVEGFATLEEGDTIEAFHIEEQAGA